MGKFLIAAGIVFVLLGLLSSVLPLLRLPGDTRYEGGHFKICFPLVSCIVISSMLTLLFNFF